MALDDFLESEVAIAVGATAAVLSPRVRGLLRSGAVYGIAGALIAGDAVASVARDAGRGARHAAASAGGVAQSAAEQARGVGGDRQSSQGET
jgi:hypothetical protein